MIKEWNLLRTIACLSIVLLHSTTNTANIVGYPDIEIYPFILVFLCYATPTFIVLSIIIIANRYSEGLPKKFWTSRIKWIYFPFLAFAVIDAFVAKYLDSKIILDQKIISNILTGKFEGWFILVIFQFYLLFYMVSRFKISMKWFLPLSLVLMYWYFNYIKVNEITFFMNIPQRMFFLAWFGYFTIAYLIGKYYKIIARELLKYRWHTLIFVALSLWIINLSIESGNTNITSYRLDLFPLVFSISAAIMAWGQLIPSFKIVNLISTYSFGIYLLHWQVQRLISIYTANYFSHTSTRVLALFIISLVISMIIIKLMSLIPFGSFIVGNIKQRKMKIVQKKELQAV